jgi:hypothetical protein
MICPNTIAEYHIMDYPILKFIQHLTPLALVDTENTIEDLARNI